jgi:hypothetical protein
MLQSTGGYPITDTNLGNLRMNDMTNPGSDEPHGSGGPIAQAWLDAISDDRAPLFAEATVSNVRLEGSVFARPFCGTREVYAALRTAGGIYDSLTFTHEAVAGARTYLEWEAKALGLDIAGVTVLTRAENARICGIAIHHRPLAAVLSFSVEMRGRLDAAIDGGHFAASSEGLSA